MKQKSIIKVCTAMVVIAGVTFSLQSFASLEQTIESLSADTKTFVKTSNKCSKCSCSGYRGYKHQNGTYEGSCSNKDSHGHTCGHGPEKHGLRKW